jgi:hypothetical protein
LARNAQWANDALRICGCLCCWRSECSLKEGSENAEDSEGGTDQECDPEAVEKGGLNRGEVVGAQSPVMTAEQRRGGSAAESGEDRAGDGDAQALTDDLAG